MMMGLAVILLIILIMIAVRVVGPLLTGRGGPSTLPPGRGRTPEELARERYARGEIHSPEYQEVMVNLLKDRYVQGDLDIAEYEQRTSHVLEEAVLVPAKTSARLKEPLAAGPMSHVPRPSTTPVATPEGSETPEARLDPAMESLRRRYLTGELTDQEYEEQRRRLKTA